MTSYLRGAALFAVVTLSVVSLPSVAKAAAPSAEANLVIDTATYAWNCDSFQLTYVEVLNIGDATVGGSFKVAYAFDRLVAGSLRTDQAVPPHESVSVGPFRSIPTEPGRHWIKILADAQHTVPESNEADNASFVGVVC
jgi:CARDB